MQTPDELAANEKAREALASHPLKDFALYVRAHVNGEWRWLTREEFAALSSHEGTQHG